jgi:cysteine desulfurase
VTYLDHAATTPMYQDAVDVMLPWLTTTGNPSSLHAAGRAARRAVEESRETIAEALGARPSEVVFTSGGTESDNIAIKGLYWSRRSEDDRRRRLLVSAVEHPAVLAAADWLAAHEGAEVSIIPVDSTGRVRPDALREVIGQDPDSVALVSTMWANNEIGAISPIAELAAVAHEFGIPLHTDAVQAIGQLPVSFADCGADAMTLTAHKLGGPLGVGALVLRPQTIPVQIIHGGGQERDVRSGTLVTPGIVGFAAAARQAVQERPERAISLAELRDALIRGVLEVVPDAQLNGPPPGHDRLPGNAHMSFPGCPGDSLLMLLDARGIECSTGSACSAGVAQPSHVLLALGADMDRARGSLRFSLGHTSTEQDVTELIAAIGPVVDRARRAGALAGRR